MLVDAEPYSAAPESWTKPTLQGIRLYFAMGFALVAGLIAGAALVAGMPSLGFITANTAMAMALIAINMLAVASIITFTAPRPTRAPQASQQATIAAQNRIDDRQP